jgi:cytochrome c553
MTKIVTAVALTLFCASIAAAQGPPTLTLKASMGNVTFPHKAHQSRMKCTTCHQSEKGGKIEGFGKDWAHKTCKGCHQEQGKGPTKCNGCHKK